MKATLNSDPARSVSNAVKAQGGSLKMEQTSKKKIDDFWLKAREILAVLSAAGILPVDIFLKKP
jgi:hypothetical protein